MVNKSTEDDYLKTTERLLKTHFNGWSISEITPLDLYDVFDQQAKQWSPTYWRKNRLAFAYYLNKNGYHDLAKCLNAHLFRNRETQIWNIENQCWERNKDGKPGKRQQRVKRVFEDDYDALSVEAVRRGNKAVLAALFIAKECGCRPSEMPNIQQISDTEFYISHSKGINEGEYAGKRGLSRTIEFTSNHKANLFHRAVKQLQTVNIGNLQKNVCSMAKDLWPQRKHRISLYSCRHQFGSNLKSSGLSREEVAYLMGHQSTSSVEQYGDRRSGRALNIHIKPAISSEEIHRLVRVNHLTGKQVEAKKKKLRQDKATKVKNKKLK